jgi:glycine receptor
LQGQPTVVYFHVTVLSLDSINEESMASLHPPRRPLLTPLFQTYVTDIFLAQSWRDPRLRLPENMKEDYRILDVEWLHNIWRPDCFFKNAKSVTFHEMTIPNHYLWLYHDKTLLYMSKYERVLFCKGLTTVFKTDSGTVLRDEIRVVPARHADMLDDDRKLYE